MYPERLKDIEEPPKRLYLLGNIKLMNEMNIAIVGSRNCSEYGRKYAKKFAKNLAQNGVNIVSGMAIGIDTVAHRGCMEAKGKTIAVLGCGFEKIYPKENKKLFYEILENDGLIISEYEPSVEAQSNFFRKRNRIVSGISLGVLVVEAAYRSGTSITAGYAKRQGRKVYCIPSSLENNKGVGTAYLVNKGAKLVLSQGDILCDFNLKFNKNKNEDKYINIKNIPAIYENIYKNINSTGSYINEIVKSTGICINEVSQKLFMMELEGFVEKRYGDLYVPKT